MINLTSMKKILYLSIITMLICTSCSKEEIAPINPIANIAAASILVTVTLHDAEDCTDIGSLSYANVYLYRSEADMEAGTIMKQGVTDPIGEVIFRNLDYGQYYVQSTYDEQVVHNQVTLQSNVRKAYLELIFEDGGN